MEDGHSTTQSTPSSFVRKKFAQTLLAIAVLFFAAQTGCQRGQSSANIGPFGFGGVGSAGSPRSNVFGGNNGGGFGGAAGSGYANNNSNSGYGANPNGAGANPGFNQQYNQLAGEVSTLNQRLGAYDADNQLLNTEVAGLKQKLELANQYNQALKQQLADTSGRIKQTDFDRQGAAQQVASLQGQVDELNRRLQQQQQQLVQNQNRFGNSSNGNGIQGEFAGFNRGGGNRGQTQLPGSATLRANNSLMRRLQEIQIPGGQTRMDGDVIRVEFPTDRMFVPGTYQIQPAQIPVLQNIASTIRQSFPRQIIGIEAHWDGTPLNPAGTTDHQLTATQSLATFDELVKLGLPRNQLFTMAMASNRPRHPQGNIGGVSPNRRIELVIYPESYDGT